MERMDRRRDDKKVKHERENKNLRRGFWGGGGGRGWRGDGIVEKR